MVAPTLLAAVLVVPLVVFVEDVVVVVAVLKKGFASPITVGRLAAVLVLAQCCLHAYPSN